jgi:hypothetical protein
LREGAAGGETPSYGLEAFKSSLARE